MNGRESILKEGLDEGIENVATVVTMAELSVTNRAGMYGEGYT